MKCEFKIPGMRKIRYPKKDAVKRIQALRADMELEFKRAKLGDHLLKLEALLDMLIEKHDLQWGDVLALVHMHMQVHNPAAQEEYTTIPRRPIFFYGTTLAFERRIAYTKVDKKRKHK